MDLDFYEEVPNWREIYGAHDRPEYVLKNGRARNCYALLDDILQLQEQIKRLKVLVEERDKTLDEYDARNNPAVAAIQYAIEQCDMGSAVEFLMAWNGGDFNALREEWDNVPGEVFEGADPLHGL